MKQFEYNGYTFIPKRNITGGFKTIADKCEYTVFDEKFQASYNYGEFYKAAESAKCAVDVFTVAEKPGLEYIPTARRLAIYNSKR
jgi:hypothetical protein